MRKSKLILTGLIGPVVTIFLIFLTTALSPWFSWSYSALSDLGVHPYSYIFNSALIFEGIMNAVFVLYLFSNGAPRTGSMMILISGIFLALVGIFTESFLAIHWAVALVYFIVFPLGIIAFTFSLRKKYRSFYISSLLLAVASLFVILIGVLADFKVFTIADVGLSVFEMTEALLLSVWSAYLSVSCFYARIEF